MMLISNPIHCRVLETAKQTYIHTGVSFLAKCVGLMEWIVWCDFTLYIKTFVT